MINEDEDEDEAKKPKMILWEIPARFFYLPASYQQENNT